jgi:hypothetical protein
MPNGSILTVIGKSDSAIILATSRAAESRNFPVLEQVVRRNKRRQTLFRRDDPVSAPILAELCYAGKSVVTNIPVEPHFGTSVRITPFNGGRLNQHSFSLVFNLRGDCPDLNGVVVILQPLLSNLEKKVQDWVPKNSTAATGRIVEFSSGWSCGSWLLSSATEQARQQPDYDADKTSDRIATHTKLGVNCTAEDYLRERMDHLLNSTLLKRLDGFEESADE